VPRSVLARLRCLFNTNRAFLLPTALPSVRLLRKLYFENAPCQLLVVGHADTRGSSDFNEKLSLERAQATVAYLKDDVDAWLGFYGSGMDAKRRWGKTEDHLMIIAMPDFREKPKGEDVVRWYQRTRGLEVDGQAGKQTRGALIEEYMSLDGASLDDLVGAVDATAHGCGEAFPLDESGEEVDAAPEDERHDPSDRRVELFFFDAEFGITPPPPGETSKPGSLEYPLWRARVVETIELGPDPGGPKVKFIELYDSLMRTNSAVVLPEGEAPSDAAADHQSLTSVSGFALVLRLNEERPGKRLFIAGHADTTAAEDFNQELSQERAECALALLTGDRAAFQSRCDTRHTVADYKQILAWIARAFPDFSFPCDPGTIDDNAATGAASVRRFQQAYNENRAAMGLTQGPLSVDGAVGPQTWGAFFDCYELALARELGEDAAGVSELRKLLVFVDDDRKALGFGEHFPVEELGVNNFRSQTNRRVELLLFDPGEEPDLAHAQDDPETSELYLPGNYERSPLPLRPGGAKPHLTVKLGLYRPTGVRSGVSYELRNDAGTYRRRLTEADAESEQDETLVLEFDEVPMDSPLTLEQILDSTSTVLASGVDPETLLKNPITPATRVISIGAATSEESLSFLSYDVEGALV
jgi:hypothetical protein